MDVTVLSCRPAIAWNWNVIWVEISLTGTWNSPLFFFWSVSVLFEEVVWIIGVDFPPKSGRQGKVEQANK